MRCNVSTTLSEVQMDVCRPSSVVVNRYDTYRTYDTSFLKRFEKILERRDEERSSHCPREINEKEIRVNSSVLWAKWCTTMYVMANY